MKTFTIDVPDLTELLVALVQQIPKRQATTYGDLARALGDHKAAVWVSEVMATPALEPWAHRVVRVNGTPGAFPADALVRLARDRVPVRDGRVAAEAIWKPCADDGPLLRLQEFQNALGARVQTRPLPGRMRSVAGIDVSYRGELGVASYVQMESGRDEPAWTVTVAVPASFPYIPGYLAFRELPVYRELLRQVVVADRVAPVLLVDGAGTLHPRRAGIATQLGVLINHPTIGVTKHRLCGSVVPDAAYGPGSGRIVDRGETVAAMLPPSERGNRPIYVSPGHRCTLDDAVALVEQWRAGRKLPEPIRRADALSRAAAKAGLEAT